MWRMKIRGWPCSGRLFVKRYSGLFRHKETNITAAAQPGNLTPLSLNDNIILKSELWANFTPGRRALSSPVVNFGPSFAHVLREAEKSKIYYRARANPLARRKDGPLLEPFAALG